MNERQMAKADFLMSIVLMAFGAYVIIESARMPTFVETKTSIWAAPGLVTGMLGFLFAGAGAIFFRRSLRQQGHRLELSTQAVTAWLSESGNHKLAGTLVLCVFYAAVLVSRIPFVVATAIFVFSFIFLFEYRPGRTAKETLWAAAMALAVAVPAALAVTLVFEKLFLVTLP